ncbi:hypothetical protein F4810DRAFT_672099 [Camillea tinctor]|nr:hypothetical protein F4810DRAFT_672099 [Camillea tinctor]
MKAANTFTIIFSALAAAGVIPYNDKDNKQDDKGLELPSCAKKCAKKFYKEAQCQGEDDHECLCFSNTFHQLAGPCIEEKCDKHNELAELSEFVKQTCGMSWSKEPETQPPAQSSVQTPTQHMPEPTPQPMPQSGY